MLETLRGAPREEHERTERAIECRCFDGSEPGGRVIRKRLEEELDGDALRADAFFGTDPDRVRDLAFEAEGREFGVTCSIGVAELGGDVDSMDELIRAADEALYGAKEAGRDRMAAAG